MYQIKIMKQCASVSVTLGTDPSSIELQWKLCEWKQTDPNALSALRFCGFSFKPNFQSCG